jgi:hypothetical protein
MRSHESKTTITRAHDERKQNVPARRLSLVLFPLLLPPTDEQVLVAVGLVKPPLQVARLDSRLKHLALEFNRLELVAFALAGLEHEGVGGVKVVAKTDEAFDVLSVGASSFAGRLKLATTEAHIRVRLVGLVVLLERSESAAIVGWGAEGGETHVELRDDVLARSLQPSLFPVRVYRAGEDLERGE